MLYRRVDSSILTSAHPSHRDHYVYGEDLLFLKSRHLTLWSKLFRRPFRLTILLYETSLAHVYLGVNNVIAVYVESLTALECQAMTL